MRRIFILLSCSVFITACESPERENKFFPLAEGKSWTYAVETAFDEPEPRTEKSKLTITNMGRSDFDGKETWRRRSDTGNEYWLRTDEKGVYRVASKNATSKKSYLDAISRTVIPANLTKEEKWSTSTVPYFLRRRNEWPPEFKYVDKYRDVTMNFAIEAMNQTVSVPAGKFTGCLLIVGRAEINLWVESANTYKDMPMITREWYCPDVGLVQLEREEPTTARFFQGGVMRMKLIQFN